LIDFDNITKTTALQYCNGLARRISVAPDDEAIDRVLFAPYAFEDFDAEDIKKRLDLLVPDNMYALYHSKLLD